MSKVYIKPLSKWPGVLFLIIEREDRENYTRYTTYLVEREDLERLLREFDTLKEKGEK